MKNQSSCSGSCWEGCVSSHTCSPFSLLRVVGRYCLVTVCCSTVRRPPPVRVSRKQLLPDKHRRVLWDNFSHASPLGCTTTTPRDLTLTHPVTHCGVLGTANEITLANPKQTQTFFSFGTAMVAKKNMKPWVQNGITMCETFYSHAVSKTVFILSIGV